MRIAFWYPPEKQGDSEKPSSILCNERNGDSPYGKEKDQPICCSIREIKP